jgi:hypothetical protein
MRRPYHILYGDALDISRLCGALPILHSIIETHGARVWGDMKIRTAARQWNSIYREATMVNLFFTTYSCELANE